MRGIDENALSLSICNGVAGSNDMKENVLEHFIKA